MNLDVRQNIGQNQRMPKNKRIATGPKIYISPEDVMLPIEIEDERAEPELIPAETIMGHIAVKQTENIPSEIETPRLDAEALDTQTALMMLHEEIGFYGHTNDEKNTMTAILGRSTVGFPVIKYLDEVEYHQRKHKPEDSTAALRSLAHSFEGYAVEAHTEAGFGIFFRDEVARQRPNLNQRLSQSFSRDDLVQNDGARRTLTTLTRIHEIDQFVEGKAGNPLGKNDGIDSLKGQARDERIFAVLDTMQLGSVMKLNERMIAEENKRFEYWRAVLEQARLRGSIKAQVLESLEKLETLRPRTK